MRRGACGTVTNTCGQEVDCGACATTPVCGNGSCESGETCTSCPADCGPCPPICGDGVCNGSETCSTCPGDCGQCTGGTECMVDADCVPATCCHPGACVPAVQAPACDGIACDAGCQEWTLDCGQGYCACQSGYCYPVYTDPL